MMRSDVCRVHPVGGQRVRPAGWMARIGWSGPARPAWLKAAGARFSCRPGQGHIVAAARLQLVRILQYARQHAMHAERDIVIQFLSVWTVLLWCLKEWTHRHFLTVWYGHHSSFFGPYRCYKIPTATALNARGWGGKIAIITLYLRHGTT